MSSCRSSLCTIGVYLTVTGVRSSEIVAAAVGWAVRGAAIVVPGTGHHRVLIWAPRVLAGLLLVLLIRAPRVAPRLLVFPSVGRDIAP